MLISILCPTRGRPQNTHRLVSSAINTAADVNQIEFVFYVDSDDTEGQRGVCEAVEQFPQVKIIFIIGERINAMTETWNICYRSASGEIFMHCGDDIEFQTASWDAMVRNKFLEFPDRITFVHGNDGHYLDTFGTHGFVHKNWVETVGYFLPPYFSCDYADTWLNDVSNKISRRSYVDILTMHMHPLFGRGPMDQTHLDRLERGRRDNVGLTYESKALERENDALKLTNYILTFRLKQVQELAAKSL